MKTFHLLNVWCFAMLIIGFYGCCSSDRCDDSTKGPSCTVLSDCCSFSPSALCTNGFCESNMFCAQDPNCFGSRWGACSSSGSSQDTVDTLSSCRTFHFGVKPQSSANQCGGYRSANTEYDMGKINEFWGSAMYACTCSPAVQFCTHNAYATPQTPGYIYYDPNLFVSLRSHGSLLPAAWMASHEAGHNLQFAIGMNAAYSIARELSADCFSGYFLAWLVCTNQATQYDISTTLMQVCSAQDPVGVPWFDPTAHGTCSQRVNAVQNGMKSYAAGVLANVACKY
ncbi:hypothetical protein A2318_00710 [Candidatus Uhrbacteria bacterium RIFOXYB2_FULL_45_11]|uniref:Uncharacterized protein n=1 Tax=Candidatus Uhrbacteria bacterium RIFOXYB2_FULL_45_11 TaxID=1802421 RepID=A0A1F7W2S0_9BACT|nr:MAG: hypothetical protein A2318_00710 [Candidatus Uhrbacteria bacterium RIFOXYB2_FULL_45_11]